MEKRKTIEINPSIESMHLITYLIMNLALTIAGVPTVETGLTFIILFLYRITRLLNKKNRVEDKEWD
jgi:hypothetical protein